MHMRRKLDGEHLPASLLGAAFFPPNIEEGSKALSWREVSMKIRLQIAGKGRYFPTKVLLVLPAAILLAVSLMPGFAGAQTAPCTCTFDTKDYEAYGTGGACGIYMYKKSHACEVSFSGTGANATVLRKELGEQAAKEQLEFAPKIFEWYVSYERQGEKKEVDLPPDFIERSLVVLVRASLFRQSSEDSGVPLAKIDGYVTRLAKEYKEKIAATFAGKDKPFDGPWGDGGKFFVGRGFVEMEFGAGVIRAVYFSEKPR
jgi:hypothetical protein